MILNLIEYSNNDYNIIEFWVDIPISVIVSFITIYIFMDFLIPEFVIKKKQYALFAILAFSVLSILGILDDYSGYWSSGLNWSNFPTWYNSILNGIYTSSNNTGFAFAILLAKKYYEGQANLAQLNQNQQESELKLLRSQVDPHFLFNNLNTLDALIDTKPQAAKVYLERLSSLYRYLIRTKDVEIMSLKEELDFAKNYIYLIKIRFKDDYNFSIQENDSLNNKYLPTGTIQTLLENVIKHNKTTTRYTVKIEIKINKNFLTIYNTKSKTKIDSESSGTGLDNLKKRYVHFSDSELRVTNTNSFFKISVPILILSN